MMKRHKGTREEEIENVIKVIKQRRASIALHQVEAIMQILQTGQTQTDARPHHCPDFHLRSIDNTTTIAQESASGQQSRVSHAISPELLRGTIYPMEHNPRGIALIIGNEIFCGNRLSRRDGSQGDVSKIDNRFREKGFQSEVALDLTKAETLHRLKQFAADEENQSRDCFVFVLLSHGNEEGIEATDEIIKVQELVAPFYSSNCPLMSGKPKIFILQCCRGSSFCHGLDVQEDSNEMDATPDFQLYNRSRPSTDRQCVVPDHADFLIVYAACQGFTAFRNTSTGSPFIDFLSEELEDMQERDDIYQVLTKMNKRFYEYRPHPQHFQNCCQMPCFESTLTKTLKFPTFRA